MVISQLTGVAMGTIDTIMVGQLGTKELAAMAMANSLLYFCFVFAFGVLNALSPLVSERFGSRDLHQIPPLVRQGMRIAILFSVFSIVLFFFSRTLFVWMHQQADLIELGHQYLQYISIGMPALFLFLTLRIFMEAVSDPKPSMYATLIGICLNIVFNQIFIYGYLGFPAMGVAGSGLATSMVYICMFLFLLVYIETSKTYESMRILVGPFATDWNRIKMIFQIGLPFGLSWTLEIAFFIYTCLMVGSLGHMQLAAHQISINFCATVFMLCAGTALAVSVQIGQDRGRGDWHLIRLHAWIGYLVVVAVGLLFMFVIFQFPEFIIGIYTKDIELTKITIPIVLIGAWFLITDGAQSIGMNILKGLKDTTTPLINSLIAFWIIGAPLCYYLCFVQEMEEAGVWWGMVVSLCLAAVFHLIRFLWVTKNSHMKEYKKTQAT